MTLSGHDWLTIDAVQLNFESYFASRKSLI
jgi:hypothetical protein